MLRFQYSNHLFLLALIPLLVAAFVGFLFWKRAKLKRLGDTRIVTSQITGAITGRGTLKFVLMALALTAIIIGWANLQRGAKPEGRTAKGIDVIIALDVSKSMLAQDVQPDRLSRARLLIEQLLDKLRNDRVGLIVFAGRAYSQVPLTADYSAVLMALQTVRPELIPEQGTVLADAISLATRSFSQKERKFKALVLISDGEDHDEGALSAARKAADDGVVIHTVGVGSPQGTPLLDPGNKLPRYDENNQPIITKLNEKELAELAKAGKGGYQLLGSPEAAASEISAALDGMEQKAYGTISFTEWDSYYYWFLAPALLLLIAEGAVFGARRYQKKIIA